MPLYEYYCPECKVTVEDLRSPQRADDPIDCPSCGQSSPQRILSLFANSVKSAGKGIGDSMAAMPSMSMGGGCCGGSCGCGHG